MIPSIHNLYDIILHGCYYKNYAFCILLFNRIYYKLLYTVINFHFVISSFLFKQGLAIDHGLV